MFGWSVVESATVDVWYVVQVLIWHVVQVSIVSITLAHIVLSDREVPSAVGWTGLVLLVPVAGPILYWIFGVNRITRKAHRLRPARPSAQLAAADRAQRLLVERFPAWLALGQLGDELIRAPLAAGNRVQPWVDGDTAYPRMLAAIAAATRSIALSSYIFEYDAAGRPFVTALAQAHRRGVAVRVLVDGVGQRYGHPPIVRMLRRHGVPAAAFLEPTLPIRSAYLNLRNHRKLLLIDGRLGFTGGLNIRADCLLAQRPRHPTRDLHFEIEGPVVSDLSAAFALDWHFTTGERLTGPAWFPPLAPVGETLARCVADGPDEDFDLARRLILGALGQARQRVGIITPYFLPDRTLIVALNLAALRGVVVEIVLPEHGNLRFVQWAMLAQLPSVLAGGARVYLSPPPFDHTKLLLIDDAWCLFGSTNWDPRSLRLNFELNVECYDRALVARLSQLFATKRAAARELRREELDTRPLPVRLRDGCARLLSPYL